MPIRRSGKKEAVIRIAGGWATVEGAPEEHYAAALEFPDKEKMGTQAYEDGRCDGLTSLLEPEGFPHGLAGRVQEHLAEQGYSVSVDHPKAPVFDFADFDKHYMQVPLEGGKRVPVWDHIFDSALAGLTSGGGTLKVPTSGGKTSLTGLLALKLHCDLGGRVLIMVPKKGLVKQTVDALKGYYADGLPTVGWVAEGEVKDGTVVVATAAGLWTAIKERSNRAPKYELIRKILKETVSFVGDECHHSGANSWYSIILRNLPKCRIRIGMSGTPIVKDPLRDARLLGACGPIVHEVPDEALKKLGLVAAVKIQMVLYTPAEVKAKTPLARIRARYAHKRNENSRGQAAYKEAYDTFVVRCRDYNACVVRGVADCVKAGRPTLLITRRKEQFRLLAELLKKSRITFFALDGDSPIAVRTRVKKQFERREAQVLLATTIFDEGESVNAIEAVVMAESVKSVVPTVQRVGRGRRLEKGGKTDVWILDFVPAKSNMLVGHGAERAETYEAHDYPTAVCEVVGDAPIPYDLW